MNGPRPSTENRQTLPIACTLAMLAMSTLLVAGCAQRRAIQFDAQRESINPIYNQIEAPQLCDDRCDESTDLMSVAPTTIKNFEQLEPFNLTLEECLRQTLSNSKVLSKLGGRVVATPQGASTIYDQAVVNSNPLSSTEAALSAFDAQFSSSIFLNHNERKLNNSFFVGGSQLTSQVGNFNAELSKTAATGTRFSLRNTTNYNRDNPFNPFFARFQSTWDTVMIAEFRQPLLRNAGIAVNRIAGPNAVPGQYNGVLLARIREDISLADFEAAVRDLVRDTVRSYWELYYAYRDLDARIEARDAARATWTNRRDRLKTGVGRPDEEAQARQQYFNFQSQVELALSGNATGTSGVLGAERQLRRLMGLPAADGTLLRPITEPTVAPIAFDWDSSQQRAMSQRVEVRRQKWNVKQRELELFAARNLSKWRFDFVGNYGWRGFGDELFGNSGVPEGSAFSDLLEGELDDWQIGFELQGPVGNRAGHLGIRNAELSLVREKALLREQKKQILHDLGAAYTEVDRAFSAIKTTYNNRVAVNEELVPKQKRVDEGEDNIFFLLDAQQRATNIESALHRAIIDYNIALLSYAYTEGDLLGQFNISLSEGPWCDHAIENMDRIAPRYRALSRYPERDTNPVSRGPVSRMVGSDPQAMTIDAAPSDPAGRSVMEPNPNATLGVGE